MFVGFFVVFLRKKEIMNRRMRITDRNVKIRSKFDVLAKKHPEWRIDYLFKYIGNEMFLSPRTIQAIIKNEGIYRNM